LRHISWVTSHIASVTSLASFTLILWCNLDSTMVRHGICGSFTTLFSLCELVSACRWALYGGQNPSDASALFSSPSHSLILQSYSQPYLPDVEKQLLFDQKLNFVRNHEINRDGWGVGWYDENGAVQRVRSASGATREDTNGTNVMTDPELQELLSSGRAKSRVMFGHIRASTAGGLTKQNAHPFNYGQLLWMHNGGVSNKSVLMHDLVERCNSKSTHTTKTKAADLVIGSTDTEIAGAVFADYLTSHSNTKDICRQDPAGFSIDDLEGAMRKTIDKIQRDDDTCGGAGSSLNFAVTDGIRIVCVRYRSCPHEEPPSLYFAASKYKGGVQSLWVASEPLDRENDDQNGNREWALLPKDMMLSYDRISGVLTETCLTDACHNEVHRRNDPSNIQSSRTEL